MNRSFWLLVSGQAVSVLGDFLESMAVGWLVYQMTGSKVAMASLFLVSWIPQVILLLFGAPFLDRVDRRRLMVHLDLFRMILYVMPPVLAWTGYLEPWHLFALQLVAGAVGALFEPALMAILPTLVEEKQLIRANAIHGGVRQAMTIAGPVLGGLLVAKMGSNPALILDALSFGLSALTLLLIPAPAGRMAMRDTDKADYWSELTAGFLFFWRVRSLLLVMIIASLSNIGIMAINTIMIPFVRDFLHKDSISVGLLQTAWGVGYLISSAVLGAIGLVRRKRLGLLGAFVVQGLSIACLGLVRPGYIYYAMAMQGLFGVTSAVLGAVISALYQHLVPDPLRGRVMAVRILIGQAAMPVGAFMGAFVAEYIGIPLTFGLSGAIIAVVAIIGFLLPVSHSLDHEALAAPAG